MGRVKAFGKRKFFGNQHKIQDDAEIENSPSSSSKKKLKSSFGELYPPKNVNSDSINAIIDLSVLSELVKGFASCKYCKKTDCIEVQYEENSRKGLSLSILLVCTLCGNSTSTMSSKKSERFYDINVRLVYAMRCIGRGKNGAETFCAVMNLPPPPRSFSALNKKIGKSLTTISNVSMKKAVDEIVDLCKSKDIVAAFDGTWQKRGHTSLNCVVSATSLETGKVIDAECITKFCFLCKNNDKNDHLCQKTFDGYSGGMEAHGALAIFRRSEATRNVRYVNYLGDGDSKAFKMVQDASVYGDEVKVTKLECIGHIQKRMGSRLRSLKNDFKNQRLSDGGKLSGRGRLTDSEVLLLQKYYGLAIRRHVDKPVSEMSKAVWAIYFHKLSTDAAPQHGLCPSGQDSWCGYNKALANNEEYIHQHSLPEAVLTAIKPIFRALSDKKILEKCTHGKTQNPNESFNNCIWKRLPKTIFVGLDTLKVGVMDAIICFNDGAQSRTLVIQDMGIEPGAFMRNALRAIDEKRINEAEHNILTHIKDIKNKKKLIKKMSMEKESLKQTDYAPGKF